MTVPPTTSSMSSLGRPNEIQTDSLNLMLKVKRVLPSWDDGRFVNSAVSGCALEREVSLSATSRLEFLGVDSTRLPSVSLRAVADGSLGSS